MQCIGDIMIHFDARPCWASLFLALFVCCYFLTCSSHAHSPFSCRFQHPAVTGHIDSALCLQLALKHLMLSCPCHRSAPQLQQSILCSCNTCIFYLLTSADSCIISTQIPIKSGAFFHQGRRLVGLCFFCDILCHAELHGPVGKLNYVYTIGRCAKLLQNALNMLSFILSPPGCYYFAFNKCWMCRLPLLLKFSPAEGAGMSDIHFQQDFPFLTIFSLQKNITTFYSSELVDNQKIYYRIFLLSGKK